MTEILIALVVIMAVVAVVLLVVAVCELVMGIKESKKEKKEEPRVVYYNPQQETAATQPAPVEPAQPAVEDAPTVEEAPAEEQASADGTTVAFGVTATRLTLAEEYEKLDADGKRRYDAVIAAAKGFEKARCKQSQYAFTVMQGQDTIGKLKFMKGVPCLDCTIVNASLKAYGKETGTKIKNKPIRFKLTDDKALADAIYTLTLANNTSFEARQKKKAE